MRFISRSSRRKIKRSKKAHQSPSMVLIGCREQFQPLSRKHTKAARYLHTQCAHFAIGRKKQELRATSPLGEHALRLSKEPRNFPQYWVTGIATDTDPPCALQGQPALPATRATQYRRQIRFVRHPTLHPRRAAMLPRSSVAVNTARTCPRQRTLPP